MNIKYIEYCLECNIIPYCFYYTLSKAPNIDYSKLQYYDYCSIKELSPRYNFKENILRLMENLYNDENLYISILCKENIVLNSKILYFQINIIKSVNFLIENLIQYNLTKYIYEIPFYLFDDIKKNNNWKIKEFNSLINKIWNDCNGLLMYDYICSDLITQIVYFYFFKKIIIRSI